mgnify:CR=1 FL=1
MPFSDHVPWDRGGGAVPPARRFYNQTGKEFIKSAAGIEI